MPWQVQRSTTVTLRGEEINITPYQLLGAIFRTIVQYTFRTELEELRTLERQLGETQETVTSRGRKSAPATPFVPALGSSAGAGSSALVPHGADDGNDEEENTGTSKDTSRASRKRRALVSPVATFPGGGMGGEGTHKQQKKQVPKMSKPTFVKQAQAFFDKYNNGNLDPDTCLQKIEKLFERYA